MRTVGSMIKELEKFSKDSMCYGYEGEDIGLAIRGVRESGFIKATELKEVDDKVPAEKNKVRYPKYKV